MTKHNLSGFFGTLKTQAGAADKAKSRLIQGKTGEYTLELQDGTPGKGTTREKNGGCIKIFSADATGRYFGKIMPSGEYRPFARAEQPKGLEADLAAFAGAPTAAKAPKATATATLAAKKAPKAPKAKPAAEAQG